MDFIKDKQKYQVLIFVSMALLALSFLLGIPNSVKSGFSGFFGILVSLAQIALIGMFLPTGVLPEDIRKNRVILTRILTIILAVLSFFSILFAMGGFFTGIYLLVYTALLVCIAVFVDKNPKVISIVAAVAAGLRVLSFIGTVVSIRGFRLKYIFSLFQGSLLPSLGIIIFMVALFLLGNVKEQWEEYICKMKEPSENVYTPESGVGIVGEKMDVAVVVLLCLFTFGIYPLIWYYKTTKYLRQFSNQSPNDVVGEFLLVMLVPFYSIYWFYKYSKILHSEMIKSGARVEDFTTLHLILAIFLNVVALILTQVRINELIDIKSGSVPAVGGVLQTQQTGSDTMDDVTEKLRELSKLKDDGILTEEDFEEKKKELLKKI